MFRSIWYVTIRGSFFRRRSRCASIPIPTRSSDSSIASACCFEIPTRDSLFLVAAAASLVSPRCEEIRVRPASADFGRSNDPPHFGNDPEFSGVGKIFPEPPKILGVQGVVNILLEITAQLPDGQAKPLGRLSTDFVQVF